MNVERLLLALAGTATLFLAVFTITEDISLAGDLDWAVIVLTTLVGGLLLGQSQYVADVASDDENRPIFEAQRATVVFWAVGYLLLFYTIMLPGATARATLPFPWWYVAIAFVLFVLVAVMIGAVGRDLRPDALRQAFREGKRRPFSDE